MAATAFLLVSFGLAVLSPVRAADSGLRLIGMMTPAVVTGTGSGYCENLPPSGDPVTQAVQQAAPSQKCTNYYQPAPAMVADEQNHLGFAVGGLPKEHELPSEFRLAVYDLKSLSLVGVYEGPASGDRTTKLTVDPARQRLFVLSGSGNSVALVDYSDVVAHGKSGHIEWRNAPPVQLGSNNLLDASSGTLTYDASSDKIYVAGTTGSPVEHGAWTLSTSVGATYNDGQPLVIAQLDPKALTVDWAVDLGKYGCGRWHVPFAQRAGDAVISYCNDPTPSEVDAVVGRQGYVIRIPMNQNAPVLSSGATQPTVNPQNDTILNAVVERMPAIPDDIQSANPVLPSVDPDARRLFLTTADQLNGTAVWVYDPRARRFVGVLTGGQQSPPAGNMATGLDRKRGIAYVLNPDGVLAVPVRLTGVPPGQNWPVLRNTQQKRLFANAPTIAVDSGLRRLFVPLTDGSGYGVVEDTTEVPPSAKPTDPDSLTSQIAEEKGKTESDLSGTGIAFGARTLVTGGLPRIVNQNDPFCYAPFAGINGFDTTYEPRFLNGQCLADQFLAGGDSDVYLASTRTDTGSTTGATAESAGLTTGSGDNATEKDLQGQGKTAAVDCNDGGETPKSVSSPSDPPRSLASSSTAECNGETLMATASSATAGVAVPNPGGSQVSVARVSSAISTLPTADGQTTVASALAEGVTIGPVTIGQVRSQAKTVAKGHSGTAKATFARQWCGISIAGQGSIPGCIDPTDPANAAMIDSINLQLGRVWISAPPANGPNDDPKPATSGGYQAVVTKSPGDQTSDSAVNNDYSTVVPGMQIIVYNDGPAGRSRPILQLAGVHAESRYAVTPIPDFGAPTGEQQQVATPPPDVPPTPDAPAAPDLSFDSGPARAATSTRVLPDGQRVVTVNARPASHRVGLPAPGRPLPERILRLPGEVIREAIRLIVENPRQLGLLALVWTLLGSPLYLALRRRARARALAA